MCVCWVVGRIPTYVMHFKLRKDLRNGTWWLVHSGL